MAAKRRYHEQRLQFVVVSKLRQLLPRDAVFWMVPNGGMMTPAARKKAAGLGEYPGASDLMVLWGGKLLCIELKVRASKPWAIPKTTYQKPEQKAFQAAIDAAGGHYAVCRSVAEVMAFLTLCGVPTRETAGYWISAGAPA